jgi:hypothetical protein
MPTNPTRTRAFLAALVAAPLLAPSLAFAQAPVPQAAQPTAPAAAPAPAPAPYVAAPSDEKSLAVLAEVRKAIGGDEKIAALKTASFEGTYRRIQGEQDMTGDLELYFAAPDKFQRVEQFSFGPNPGPRIAQTVNGTEGWMGPLGPVPGGMVMRFGGPGGPGGPGGGPGGPGGNRGPGGPGGQRFDPGIVAKQLYWRTALAMFPGTAATSALSFTYVGKAESPDGEAEVLDVKGEGDFKARLFVDAKTHLPVMLTYQERERRIFRQTQRNQGETDEAFRARIRAEREAAGPPPPPKMIDISMFITEHKDVGGVKIPHHFTMQTGDKPTEEWDLKKAKANPKLDDEQFKRKTSN